jgi:hypothetical protein
MRRWTNGLPRRNRETGQQIFLGIRKHTYKSTHKGKSGNPTDAETLVSRPYAVPKTFVLRLIRINLLIMRPRQCRRGMRPEFLGALPPLVERRCYAFQPGGQRLGSARLALPNGFDAPTLRSREFGIPPIPLHVRPAWVSSIGGDGHRLRNFHKLWRPTADLFLDGLGR